MHPRRWNPTPSSGAGLRPSLDNALCLRPGKRACCETAVACCHGFRGSSWRRLRLDSPRLSNRAVRRSAVPAASPYRLECPRSNPADSTASACTFAVTSRWTKGASPSRSSSIAMFDALVVGRGHYWSSRQRSISPPALAPLAPSRQCRSRPTPPLGGQQPSLNRRRFCSAGRQAHLSFVLQDSLFPNYLPSLARLIASDSRCLRWTSPSSFRTR